MGGIDFPCRGQEAPQAHCREFWDAAQIPVNSSFLLLAKGIGKKQSKLEFRHAV
jgi:hypothetical protein